MGSAMVTQRRESAPALWVRPHAHADERAADAAERSDVHAHGAGSHRQADGAWPAPPIAREVALEAGHTLDAETQRELAGCIPLDLSTVRVHADARAARAADAVHAEAYTVGCDIVFAANTFAPQTPRGRQLLLHELAHVLQQGCATREATVLHRKGKPGAPKGSTLQDVLDSTDDDAVRDFVDGKAWAGTILEPWQAAWLMIFLLDGVTGDDDEQAGLKIIDNVVTNARLDLTLTALKREGRWEQLFDDYHGAEYGELLARLARGITTLAIRADFLDKFIDEWFVDLREEQAIARMLNIAPDAELEPLLGKMGRESKLRDAIDNTAPRRDFERRVVRKNELNFNAKRPQVEAALAAHAQTAPQARARTQQEVADLLADAPRDLIAEVTRYRDQLKVELDKPEPDWDVVSKLHQQFVSALNTIEARKKAELEMELRYNVQLNIYERDPAEKDPNRWGTPWTEADLAELDRLLQKIPPEILQSTTDLQRIRRATQQPWLAGQGGRSQVTLYGSSGLKLDVLLHELGHTVAYTDASKMQILWDRELKWEVPAPADVPAKIKKKLDAFTDDELKTKDARVKDGDWYYRKNRYTGDYVRHPADMCFVSDYAATAASDDFAETFSEYVLHGPQLKKDCPDKYDFMHQEVFVKFFLEKQQEREIDRFNNAANEERDKTPADVLIASKVTTKFVTPLRREMVTATTAKTAQMHTAAEAGIIQDVAPLAGDEQSKVAAPFTRRLRAVYALLKPVSDAERAYSVLFLAHPFKKKASETHALNQLGEIVKDRMLADLVAEWEPLAVRAAAGTPVTVAEFAGAAKTEAKYTAAIPRIQPEISAYAAAIRVSGNPFEPQAKVVAAQKKEAAIVDRILNPKPTPRGKVRRQASGEHGQQAMPPARPERLVPAGGRPLAADTRAFMERQIGRDFRDVRVHDDAEAAASAETMQADAYTVGQDIVFGEGKHAPDTADGRQLLGHELAHVAQQEAGGPGQGAAPGANADRMPAVLEEPVSIPNMAGPEIEAPEQSGPEAPVPEQEAAPAGEERPPAAPGPVVALSRDPGSRGGASALDVAPPDHPSEIEAAAIGRRVAGREHDHTAPGHARAGTLHRQPTGGGADTKKRVDIVFFMGHRDPNPRNQFYRSARIYFRTNVMTDRTVDTDRYRSLAGVFEYLRGLDPATPLGNVYLVSHANEDGTLSFPLASSDNDRRTTYGEIKEALQQRPELFELPFGLVDRQTVIHIKGCNIGRSQEMLNKLDEAFGGRGLVTAPTHKQQYSWQQRDGQTTAQESLHTYFLEYAGGDVRKKRAEQIEEFSTKYPHISRKRWEALLPRNGATREVPSNTYSVEGAASIDEAKEMAEKWGTENFTRPEMYVWRVSGRPRRVQGRLNVVLVAEKTNYVIRRTLEDSEGKRLVPDESDPAYFGKSDYYKTPTTAAELRLEPGKMTTPALISRIAELDTEIATPQAIEDEGRKREAEFERQTMRGELERRNIAVDVKVVKTEDWLGADEVYVRASRGSTSIQTKTHKLNDGHRRVYLVPMLSFLPLNAPIRFDVYDEDWPDRDDLIVQMDWRPPFAPMQNSESKDEADYRVEVRFER